MPLKSISGLEISNNSQQIMPFSLRAAYGTFFFIQLETFLHFSLSCATSIEAISIPTLAFVFFLAQKHPLSSYWGSRLVVVFLFHNLILLAVGSFLHISQKPETESCDRMGTLGICCILCLFWVGCAIQAIRAEKRFAIKIFE